ncbi:MAG: phasin family protein [Spirochaetales bacterium]|nr:phasin family protein [Spirochaetales bacterium]
MLDVIKKGVLLGLGAITLTKEKAEEFADELIKKGGAAQDKKNEIVNDLLKKAQTLESDIEKKIGEQVRKTLTNMGVPTKEDFEELKTEIKKISSKLDTAK